MRTLDGIHVLFIVSSLFILILFLVSEKKYLKVFFFSFYALFVLKFYQGIFSWIKGLGGDSFLEAIDFNSIEALSWTGSLLSNIFYMSSPLKYIVLLGGQALFIALVAFFIFRKRFNLINFSFLMLILSHFSFFYSSYQGYMLGRSYVSEMKNSFSETPSGFSAKEKINLFVYIGESTSTFNMSLYGYPLATTPRLSEIQMKDRGFVRFDKVRSTHTHTSLSLLRAFSTSSSTKEKLWGVGGILKNAGISAKLYSVQPLTGSFATSSKFIFDGMEYPDVRVADRYKGNLAVPVALDHELLSKALSESGVVFFHSYAGHAPYLNFVDLRMTEDVKRPSISIEGLIGSSYPSFLNDLIMGDISDYDRAVNYIDKNVSRVINAIKNRNEPSVMVYFSDHGESVYTRRAHESSMFIDEMTTVPFILYFNAEYQRKYPEIVDKYKEASAKNSLRLLDQLLPTILDVGLIESEVELSIKDISYEINRHLNPTIVERKTIAGHSEINLRPKGNKYGGFSKFFGGTPEPTWTFILNEQDKDKKTYCYHRSNSYAKALRGVSVSNCIEVDLVVEGQNLFISHPPIPTTGFSLTHVFDIAAHRKNKIWIDAKNIDNRHSCQTLLSFLIEHYARVGEILVEFPPTSSSNISDIAQCSDGMRALGIRTSYYVPDEYATPCSANPVENANHCKSLSLNIKSIIESGVFTDLSFDVSGYKAIDKEPGTRQLNWNTWLLDVTKFGELPSDHFDFVIVDSSKDPNSY